MSSALPPQASALNGCVLFLMLFALGCSGHEDAREHRASARAAASEPASDSGPDAATLSAGIVFTEVAREAGIDFVHNTGAFGRKWLPETMGSGCAWVDVDGDGDADALLLSGRDFEGHPTSRRQTSALYRNESGRGFVDMTVESGLDEPIYGMGVTCGDMDADGDADLFVTALGPNRLYRNDGGRFRDVAGAAGVDEPGFGSSAAWFDYDRDGDLDLVVLNYVTWTPDTDIYCSLDGVNKSYCTPEAYPGASPILYRNDGGGVFTDVTEDSGVHDPTAKALGVVCFDYDGDGWDDVYVANDTQPNFLYRNRGDGSFVEEGMMAGVAFDEDGRAQGAMGVDIADYDGSGLPSIVVGNFSNEMLALYHNEGKGFFIDAAPTSAVGRQSLLTLAFATLFFDANLDGRPDIFVGNGHVEDEIQKVQSRVAYEQPPHLFLNIGGGRFEDVAPQVPALQEPIVARGGAFADYDGDGDLDLLVNTSGDRARLFRNEDARPRRSVRIRLAGGAGSNPDGYGAKLTAKVGGQTRTLWARSGHSYLSQSERVLTVGLGAAPQIDELEVDWPSGKVSRATNVPAGSTILIREDDSGGE